MAPRFQLARTFTFASLLAKLQPGKTGAGDGDAR